MEMAHMALACDKVESCSKPNLTQTQTKQYIHGIWNGLTWGAT